MCRISRILYLLSLGVDSCSALTRLVGWRKGCEIFLFSFWLTVWQCCDLENGLEIRVHSSSFCPGLGLGLETWRPRSRSWSQDSMLSAYACSMITVICSTFKRVFCHQLELLQPVLWSRDHGLETRVHSSSFCPGLSLGLETWSPRSRSWSRDLKKVLTTTLRCGSNVVAVVISLDLGEILLYVLILLLWDNCTVLKVPWWFPFIWSTAFALALFDCWQLIFSSTTAFLGFLGLPLLVLHLILIHLLLEHVLPLPIILHLNSYDESVSQSISQSINRSINLYSLWNIGYKKTLWKLL